MVLAHNSHNLNILKMEFKRTKYIIIRYALKFQKLEFE